ncbi:MAG: AAA family ATPase [Planctomycetia bacterium]|nr:AAA family ATPase [Planctomycetia bacterium]
MKVYKAPVVLWKDAQGNWYGRHVEPVLFLPPELRIMMGNDKGPLLKALKTSLKKALDTFQKDHEDIKPVEERQFEWSTLSFTVRPSQQYMDGNFPERHTIELSSPIVWRTDDNGVTHVLLPLENIEFSALKHDSFRELAREALRQWYLDAPQRVALARTKVQQVTLETLTISLERVKRTFYPTNDSSPQLLNRLAVPINRALRRQLFISPFGRDNESRLLANQLINKPNLILCGPNGCGKSTLLVDAALAVQKQLAPAGESSLQDTIFWWTNVRRMTAGTKWHGEWQQQLADLLTEVNRTKAVLCIENLAELLDSTTSPHSSFAAFLIPYLEDEKINIVGETTPESLRVLSRALPAFVERFEVMRFEPMNEDTAASAMLEYAKTFQTDKRNLTVEGNVPPTVTHLYRRFFSGSVFPGPAFSFLRKSLKTAYKKKINIYTQENVYDDFLHETGLPEFLFRDELTISRAEIEAALEKGVVGQPEAVSAAASAVLRFKAALNHPKKPIASFLFCGPTGVGKTQLVRTLAEYLFAGGNTLDRHKTSEAAARRFLRLDMSEYQFSGAATRMVERLDGSPGPLIEHIRREPFSVILFDEFEKASHDVSDLLMNLLDEGRLTDRIGRTFDFRNTILIMTSNLGTSVKRVGGFIDAASHASIAETCEKEVLEYFRPEFFNRIDELIVFRPLDQAACRKIVQMEISALDKREGVATRKLHLTASDKLINVLVADGFHPAYGARPLRREIEKRIVPVLARFLHHTKQSNTTVLIDLADDDSISIS